jgi:tetratricopeptide (TPR) repeat protein
LLNLFVAGLRKIIEFEADFGILLEMKEKTIKQIEKTTATHKSVWICVFLILATSGVYWQVGGCDFINFDDPEYVVENSYVNTGLSGDNVIWAFTAFHSSNWHPLTWISHMVDSQVYGLNAGGHHVTNLVLHIINAILLFLLLKAMTGSIWPSAFVACLFALHPVHIESVAWVSERKDVLSTLFWFLTMGAYLRYGQKKTTGMYVATLILFGLGLMAKPMLVTVPFILLLMDYWPLNRFDRQRYGAVLVEKIPFFLLTTGSCIVTFFAQLNGDSVLGFGNVAMQHRLGNTVLSYAKYIGKMFWPTDLAIFYPFEVEQVNWQIMLAGILLIGMTVFVFRFGKRYKYLVFGWFWYLGTLVPVIGLMQVGAQGLANRYTYVPYTGLFIIIAWGAGDLFVRWRFRRAVLSSVSVVIILVLSVVTYTNVFNWRDTKTLFEHAIEVTEKNLAAHHILGDWLLRRGQVDESIVHNLKVAQINSRYFYAYENLGAAYDLKGQTKRAMDYYLKAIEVKPNTFYANINLASRYSEMGDFPRALRHLKTAMSAKPNNADLIGMLAGIYAKSGRFEEALKEYQKVLQLNPNDANICFSMGYVQLQMGRINEAIEYYNRALRIDPELAAAYHGLGNCYFALGQVDKSIDSLNRSLQIKPEFFSAYFDLGIAYYHLKNYEQAARHFEEALRINPDSADTKKILGQLKGSAN